MFIIREMQIKAKMSYQLTPVRMVIIKKSTNSKCCRGCRQKEILSHSWWKGKWTQTLWRIVSVSSVTQSCSTLRPHESQHTRPSCPSPTPGVYSNSCPLSQRCHPAISSSVIPFSSCPQSLLASGSFPMSQLFA